MISCARLAQDATILIRLFTVRVAIGSIVMALLLVGGCADRIDRRVSKLTSVLADEAHAEVQEKIIEYQQRVEATPLDATAIGNLGVVYELHGFPEEALEAYELAETLEPDEFRWRYYQSILMAARFDLEHALEKIAEAVERQPDYAPAWFHKGKMLLDSNRFEEALATFQHAKQLTDDPYAHLGQALAYMELNEPQAALDSINKTGFLMQHVNVKRLRANALMRVGRRDEGAVLLKGLPTATMIRWRDPVAEAKNEHAVDHLVIRVFNAIQLVRNESYEQAKTVLEELNSEYPTNRQVIHVLSAVYEQLGDHDQALAMLYSGIRHHPDFYAYRTAVASLLKDLGKRDEALTHIDKAIEIAPNLHWGYSQKGQILMEQKRWLEASHMLDKAIGMKGDDVDLYTYLGICLGFMNRWPEAANLFQVAISIDPEHVPGLINLARAETFLLNEDGAIEALEKARRHGASDALLASVEKQRTLIKQMQIETVGR